MEFDADKVIKGFELEQTQKYLGKNDGYGIQHASMKEKIRKGCYKRVRAVLKLNGMVVIRC